MERINHIRVEHNEMGKSMRQISRETGFSRSTVSKYIHQTDFNPTPMKSRRRRRRRSDAYRSLIRTWLMEDEKAPRKQRHTARRIYHRLKEQAAQAGEVFNLSERTIRGLVAEIRAELKHDSSVSLPLLHPAGEAQVDFGKTAFYGKGVYFEGYHLAVSFPHSTAGFVQLFKAQNFDCFAQGLTDIFTWIGAVPDVIRFDNMSIAVKEIFKGDERALTDLFLRLQNHYQFQSVFCNPASGHEKGSVENYVGTSRRNLFVPVPEIDDLEAYNRELLERCQADLQREHYKHPQTVFELFQEDLEAMKPLAEEPFSPFRYEVVKTNAYGFFNYQTNRYSTSRDLAHTEVSIKVGAHKIWVYDRDFHLIAQHPRLYGKNQEIMVWKPYLPTLAQRPRALCYSGFYDQLPEELQGFLGQQDRCSLKKILTYIDQASDKDPLTDVIHTLHQAVGENVRDADDLLATVQFQKQYPFAVHKNPVPESFAQTPTYTVDFQNYQILMGEGHATTHS